MQIKIIMRYHYILLGCLHFTNTLFEQANESGKSIFKFFNAFVKKVVKHTKGARKV